MAAVAIQVDADDLIDQVANGALLRDLARHTGIDKRALSRTLLKHPDYQTAKQVGIELRLDEAEATLRTPDCDIARAREVWRAATWRAERECPDRWGAKQELGQLSVTVQVVAFSPQNLSDIQALRSTGVMSSNQELTSVAPVQQILAVSATPAKHAFPQDRGGSPVAPPLVDCVGDQSPEGG